MEQLADGVWQIPLMPRHGINAYLLGDVLVDAGIRQHGRKVVADVAGHTVRAHALTHAHADHAGGSHHVTETLGIPMWAPAGDADDLEAGRPTPVAHGRTGPLLARLGGFPAVPVARRLAEGDEVGGFRVLDVPGHSPGHIAYWRESDRVLVLGDVFFNAELLTLRERLGPPVGLFTWDLEQNRRSMRRLAELEPALALFGHGPPLRDPAALRRIAGE